LSLSPANLRRGITRICSQCDDDSELFHEAHSDSWHEREAEELSDEDVDDLLLPNLISLEDLKSLTKQNTNLAYFYLQNEIGITEEDMWRITNEAGSVLGMTARNLRKKVQLLQQTMDLTDDDIRTMILRHPAVLHLSAQGNVAPTILFLQRALDLSREDMRKLLVSYPSILGYSLANLKSKINFYLKLCRFTKDEARKLLVEEPKLMTAGVTTGLIPRLHFFVGELKFTLENFRVVVKKNPLILLASLEKNLRPKLQQYLQRTLTMNTKQVQTIITKYPQFVNYHLNNQILPITEYYCQELNFRISEFAQILVKFPRLVTHSLLDKIKHVVGFLRYELGMDASQVKRVLYQAPQIMNLNTDDTLKGKIHYLREALGLSDEELRRILAGMPTLTICSTEANLKPKIDYLSEVLDRDELKKAALILPTLLGYSLDKRIRPRMAKILESGVDPSAITVGIPMKDDAFDQWLNGRRARVRLKHIDETNKPLDKSTRSDGRIVHWTRPRRHPTIVSKRIS
jgi:mTERF domain-containing protein